MTRMLRLATPADAAACQRIYAPHVRDSAVSFEVEAPTAAEFEARITRTLERLPWLVCVDGDAVSGAVIGYAYAAPHQERAAFQWSVNVSLYVDEAVQRGGIGRALYTALLAGLRSLGYCNAYAAIALPHPASVALHEALGFAPIGQFTDVGYKLGAWHTVGWWGLRLQSPSTPAPPTPLPVALDTPAWRAAIDQGNALLR